MEVKLKHKDIWNGEYNNVRFEIVKWQLGGDSPDGFPCWNYYIYLPIEQIPEEYHKYFCEELPQGGYLAKVNHEAWHKA